jgi:hypothetical protein
MCMFFILFLFFWGFFGFFWGVFCFLFPVTRRNVTVPSGYSQRQAAHPMCTSRTDAALQHVLDPLKMCDGFEMVQAEMSQAQQEDSLRYYTDLLRLSLAGNLRDYRMVDRYGSNVVGYMLPFGSAGAGYTRRPCENIVYAACHDNETLFDQVRKYYMWSATTIKPYLACHDNETYLTR